MAFQFTKVELVFSLQKIEKMQDEEKEKHKLPKFNVMAKAIEADKNCIWVT